MEIKTGFVYIWYDRKRKMYYIGSHWGSKYDGYVCSSNRMRDAYRRRPQDFKRRILREGLDSKESTLIEENRWLNMIPKNELGKRYYNHRNGVTYLTGSTLSLTSRRKISQKLKKRFQDPDERKRTSEATKKAMWGPEVRSKMEAWYSSEEFEAHRLKMSEDRRGSGNPMYGTIMSDESKEKLRQANTGRIMDEEFRKKVSAGLMGKPNLKLKGRPRSEETKEKIRQTLLGKKHSLERIEANRLGQLRRYSNGDLPKIAQLTGEL